MVMQRQKPIVVNAVVGDDHRVIVDLPPDGPTGSVMVMIAPTEPTTSIEELTTTPINPERERLRAILLAAGKLGTAHYVEHVVYPKDESWMNAGHVPEGTPSSEEILRDLRSDE